MCKPETSTASAASFSHADYIARDEALNKSLDKSTIKYVPSGLGRDRRNYLSRLITRSHFIVIWRHAVKNRCCGNLNNENVINYGLVCKQDICVHKESTFSFFSTFRYFKLITLRNVKMYFIICFFLISYN